MKKIYVVGLGPGKRSFMTERAVDALADAELLCGYKVYTDLALAVFPEKEVVTTPMTKETERCRLAFEHANAGKTVAMVCSGDPGVYGMAGLIYELSAEFPEVEVEVVPGVTAAQSGAAVLGAPLVHDFAVISLSDLLTPWEDIERRALFAAKADFVLCLYNVSSMRRKDHLQKICELLMPVTGEKRVCGWVKNIGREGENCGVMTIKELAGFEADMFTTVFIGKSTTKAIGGKMVTPRGYEKKAEI